jgi:hypothetical protein
MRVRTALLSILFLSFAGAALAQRDPNTPTWWDKYTYLAKNGPDPSAGATSSLAAGLNVDVSNECGPQSDGRRALHRRRDNPLPLEAAGVMEEVFTARVQ